MSRKNNISLKLDIEELMSKLESMLEDDYVTADITIKADEYDIEICIGAVDIEQDQVVSYSTLENLADDFL